MWCLVWTPDAQTLSIIHQYYQEMISLFALVPIFQAAIIMIYQRPSLAKKQILSILHLISQFWGQHSFSIWSKQLYNILPGVGTTETCSITLTHGWWLKE